MRGTIDTTEVSTAAAWRRRGSGVSRVALGMAVLLSATTLWTGAASAARTVTSYTFAPSPLAPGSALGPNAKVSAKVTAKDSKGIAVGGATIYLSFVPTAGGGTATTHAKTLGSTPQSFRANSLGQLLFMYRTPRILPPGGIDTITAANAATSPSLKVTDVYNYGVPPPPPADWPMFHNDPAHLGVSADAALSATHAPGLSLQWQTTLATGSFSSPAVAYNTTLAKSVLYIGDQSGTKGGALNAVDAATGTPLWTFPSGGNILSSPAVANGVVYVGTSGNTNHRLLAINATTGKLVCSFTTDFAAPGTSGKIDSSPVVADPGDGGGPVVYFGDSGPLGIGSPDQGAFWAINAATCALKWEFGPTGTAGAFNTLPSGEYSQPGFAKDSAGHPLVIFGTTDNDDSIYALNASTGAMVWRFQTLAGIDTDIGAGPTISAPGVNGFADGVVYETGKDRQVYALDLTTGSKIWSFDIKTLDTTNKGDSQSVAALVGNSLFLGWGGGVVALNATTGGLLWSVKGLPTVFSSPAVAGPAGGQVIILGDSGGTFRVYDLTGKPLFSTATGGMIYSSPAVSGGKIFFANAVTGVLYAYG